MIDDSVSMVFRDGTKMSGRDSGHQIQAVRDQFGAVTSRVDAVVFLRSTDKEEDWVCVWGVKSHR
jgi:hypothetical protein